MRQSLWLCSNCICVFFNTIIAVISCQLVRIYIIQYCVYPMTVNLHKGPPTPTERRAKLCQWRKHVLRAEGGGFRAQCWGNVLLWAKSDEQKMPGPLLLVYFMVTPLQSYAAVWKSCVWILLSYNQLMLPFPLPLLWKLFPKKFTRGLWFYSHFLISLPMQHVINKPF